MSAPDFIGVGTHLSGSPWWYELLLEHPQIAGPVDGERSQHFFAQFCDTEMTEADVAAYHARFDCPEGQICGEWTDRYLYDVWTLPLLRRVAPEAKILVMLRDPVERYISSLRHRIDATVRPEQAPYMTEAVHRGRYASQLRALYAFFPREQVLVLQGERCREDPLTQFRRTVDFLGVDAGFVAKRHKRLARGKPGPILAVRILRAMGVPESVRIRSLRRLLRPGRRLPRVELWPDLEAALHDALDREMLGLRELEPEIDLALWPHFAHLA